MFQQRDEKYDSKQEVQRIPIDPDGKQILIAYGLESGDVEYLMESLRDWMQSERSVFFAALPNGARLEFVRFPLEETEAKR